jgi:hypothetical protein
MHAPDIRLRKWDDGDSAQKTPFRELNERKGRGVGQGTYCGDITG